MAEKMFSPGKRFKSLSKNTSRGLSHSCTGLVELYKHLLNTTHHEYVMLGKFFPLAKTNILLRLDADNDFPNLEAGHSCIKCG